MRVSLLLSDLEHRRVKPLFFTGLLFKSWMNHRAQSGFWGKKLVLAKRADLTATKDSTVGSQEETGRVSSPYLWEQSLE